MAELNPVPFGRRRGPRRERRHRTVPTIGKSARRLFVPVRFCNSCECNEPGPFREGREGRSGSETGSEVSEIMISGDLRPWKSPQRRVGQGRSVGPTRVGIGPAHTAGSVGRGR
jgi:hypothetical protein